MKANKFMSQKWVDEFNTLPFDTKLERFKKFSAWQQMWYLTTAFNVYDPELVRFRRACRSLFPPPVMTTGSDWVYSDLREDQEELWNV